MKRVIIAALAAGTLWQVARYFKLDTVKALKDLVFPAVKQLAFRRA
jgi:hypothetical protein